MRAKFVNILWGVILILAGLLFLAQNYGYVPELSVQVWMVIFSVVSLLFFASYFLSGVENWGWLFPATIFGALAITLALAEVDYNESAIGAPILISVAIPFVVAYILDRQKNRWALIPTWVLLVISLITIVADRVEGEAIGSLVLFAVALPFLVIFGTNREKYRWALIPGAIIAGVGFIPMLASRASGELIGAYVLFAIALPFLVIYLSRSENWWALIPAGIMASIGLALLLTGGGESMGADEGVLFSGIMFLGWGLTLGALWVRPGEQRQGWAMYPALGLVAAGLVAVLFGTAVEILWPLILVTGGALILFMNLRKR